MKKKIRELGGFFMCRRFISVFMTAALLVSMVAVPLPGKTVQAASFDIDPVNGGEDLAGYSYNNISVDMSPTFKNVRTDMDTAESKTIDFTSEKLYVYAYLDGSIQSYDAIIMFQQLYNATNHEKVEFVPVAGNRYGQNPFLVEGSYFKENVAAYATDIAIGDGTVKNNNSVNCWVGINNFCTQKLLMDEFPMVLLISGGKAKWYSKGTLGTDLADAIKTYGGADAFAGEISDYDTVIQENNQEKYNTARTDADAEAYYRDCYIYGSKFADNTNITKIREQAAKIVTDSMTDYEKAKAIHDWVCSNIAYDNYGLANGSYDLETGISRLPYQVLEKKKGVCQDYADLYAELCKVSGIPCKNVYGYALKAGSWNCLNYQSTVETTTLASHAWNEVLIDKNDDGTKEWVIVDTTWDSNLQINDASGTVTGVATPKQTYFDPAMVDFSKDHRTDVNGNDEDIIGGTLAVDVTAGDSNTKANVTITPSDFRGWDTYGVTVSDGEKVTTFYWTASTTKPVTKSIDVTPGETYTVSVIGYNTYQAIIEDGRAYGIKAAPIQYTAETGDVPDDKTYTITYELNGGENNSENPATYTDSTKQITLKNPTRTHYTFLGWYDSPDFTNRVTAIAGGSTGDITLYAKWVKNNSTVTEPEQKSYTISYVLNGGTNNKENPASYKSGTAVTLKTPVRKGYSFDGWYTDSQFKTRITKISATAKKNYTLYAKWTKNKVSRIMVKGMSKKIAAGKKIKLTAVIFPNDTANRAVMWTSSNTKYASVSGKGIVKTKKAGAGKSVTITAAATDGSKATYKIQILKHSVKSIKLSAKSRSIKAGKKLRLKAKVKTTGKTANKSLLWASSNARYAKVSGKGVVKAMKAGKGKKVRITAMATDGTGKKCVIRLKVR